MEINNTAYNLQECQSLANAIIIQATRDYQSVLRYKARNNAQLDYDHQILYDELTKFFCGKWFAILTNIDGRWLMQTIEEQFMGAGRIKQPKTHFAKDTAKGL